MKNRSFTKKALIGFISMALMSGSAFSQEKPQMSKPQGAVGMGEAKMGATRTNQFWWPDQLNLSPLRDHDLRSNPYGADFNYAEAFNSLDLDTVKSDIDALLTQSQDWWPADLVTMAHFLFV